MRTDELRPALYHRLHHLLPFVSSPLARGLARWLLRGLLVVYFAFVIGVLSLRYYILPQVENYRPEIGQALGRALGLAVSIGRIQASWDGLNPDLILSDVRIADTGGRPALAFSRVESVVSWSSLPRLELRLSLLRIDEPTLHLRRDSEGQLFVAGIPVNAGGGETGFADWVLAQRRIRISGATIVWEDEKRGAPPLILEDVNVAVDRSGRHHRFGLTALPPAGDASRLDLRGDFEGRDVEELSALNGQAFVEIDRVDLAVWRTWLDYPIALPHGRGALRAWVTLAAGNVQQVTADLSLDDVRLRLAGNLPELEVDHLSGRLAVRSGASAMRIEGRHFELLTSRIRGHDDAAAPVVRIEPTDFHVEWQSQPGAGVPVRGSAEASAVDLGALARLAIYLPLDAGSRKLLDDFAPRGAIGGLQVSWLGDADALHGYSLKARFHDLGFRAQGRMPGVTGLSGVIEASNRGGSVQLASRKVRLDLPQVFPESSIELDALNAQTRWKIGSEGLDVELLRAEFSGADAAGSAQGRYHRAAEGPGSIDLTATLSRADARAVWRYLPLTVNVDARHWLRDSLKAGRASEAKLTLKGDLARFPFVDPKHGQFLVTAKAHDVTLDYATGWPMISGMDAELRFEGVGMTVHSRNGSILGARLVETRAEIPDLDAPVSTLKVQGRAEGETAEFLRFIRDSPVAGRIDHFTDEMSASGKGRLDIALVIPLDEAHLGESKVDGSYHFLGNEVTVDSALPPLRQVRGSVRFSEQDLRVPEIGAQLLGGQLRISGGSQGGKVLIGASGTLSVDELRRRVQWRALDRLSGSTAYRAEVRVRKRDVELVVDSNLVGVGSTLPAPLDKTASEALPLHFERVLLPSSTQQRNGRATSRDQLRVTLGSVLSGQLIRRREDREMQLERGAIVIGRALPALPERGLSFGCTARTVDVDAWQKLIGSRTPQETAPTASLLPVAVDLKADELIVVGAHYRDAAVSATGEAGQWRGTVQSREAVGNFLWDGTGAGRLAAQFRKWRRPDQVDAGDEPAAEALSELPALDVVVEEFTIGERRFGRLDVQAHNEGGLWRLDRVQLANPHGSLTGSGQWEAGKGNRTQLDFTLESNDVGKLLERLNHGGVVRGGTATLKGRIGWNGPPTALDYASLSGEMQLEASGGRFVKVDPGVGKLLGLLSLQGLPRRLSLDFGDVFSEGFAFDRIHGGLTVSKGVMHTKRLQIVGPAAQVVMRGDADLKNETQQVNVVVQPELGGSAALGVAVINPVAGLATLLADKVLQHPLGKVFSVEYLVTGKWDDPKVEKVSRTSVPESAASISPGASDVPPVR